MDTSANRTQIQSGWLGLDSLDKCIGTKTKSLGHKVVGGNRITIAIWPSINCSRGEVRGVATELWSDKKRKAAQCRIIKITQWGNQWGNSETKDLRSTRDRDYPL